MRCKPTLSALKNSSKSSVPLPSVSHASNALLYSWVVEACSTRGDTHEVEERRANKDAEGHPKKGKRLNKKDRKRLLKNVWYNGACCVCAVWALLREHLSPRCQA